MWLSLLVVLGLCLGSFVNALVWRMHEKASISDSSSSSIKHSKKYLKDLSIVNGRSMCPDCHHQLQAIDLIPVISWITLRGKCRYCHKSISIQYPIVELTLMGLFIVSYFFWPMPFRGIGEFEFITWLIILTGLVALALFDLKWFLLPNVLTYSVIVIALVQLIIIGLVNGSVLNEAIGAISGVLILGGTFYLLFQISKGRWIGGGDVKLGVALGLLVGGPLTSILLLFIASLSGTLYSIPLMAMGKARRGVHIPFGPFLIIATVICRLFGASIINWYKKLYF
jgi:leader peptidase (prepilin peptidase)/N-methyltransferase